MTEYYSQFAADVRSITAPERGYLEARLAELEATPMGPDFGWEWDTGPDGDTLTLLSMENGCIDAAAEFVQDFLKKFRPREKWGAAFAFYASAPEVGSIGGGAVVVTAKSMKWMNLENWLEKQLASKKGKKK